MTDLSPAAEAVLNAVTLKRYDVPYYACPKSIDQIKSDVAAALRVVADQLINVNWSCEMWELHRDIHAIAAELEGTND